MAFLDSIKNLLPGGKKAGSVSGAQAGKTVNKRVVLFGILLVLSIVMMAVLFSVDIFLSRPNAGYNNVVSEQQIISQQITVNAIDSVLSGDQKKFKSLDANQNRYLEILRLLDAGDSAQGVPPLPDTYSVEYSNLKNVWNGVNRNIDLVLSEETTVKNIYEQARLVRESLPRLITLTNSIVSALVNAKAPHNNVALAGQQLALLQGIEGDLSQIVSGGPRLLFAADNLAANTKLIKSQIDALLKGNAKLNISRVIDNKVVIDLVESNDNFDVAKDSIDEILNFSAKFLKAHESARAIQSASPALLDAARNLNARISRQDAQLQIFSIAGYGFGALSLVLLIILVWMVVNESRTRLTESQDQNEKNQRAILRLLDEMTNLADGDLSTHTTVTEDITGAIADSVNYSIDALRDLVGTINKTSVQVSSAVQKTQNTTGQLAEASVEQTREIVGASETITSISRSMSDVSEKAADSAEVARKSVSIAHKGGETVRQTIAGMETIREQIQETSKRIKRLGESSQEIGDIVNLITEISDQTNILALNAAIQASMAGEAGRGFAVVADEVQRLAERTGDATKQIEALVKTIQADTNEATVSMEQSTANVVKGAKLTENAGSALDRIEQVSMNLAQRILEISDATKNQAAESVKITQTMDSIQGITQKTSEGSMQASNSIGELTQMVQAMQDSVAGFKLPGMRSDSGHSDDPSPQDFMR